MQAWPKNTRPLIAFVLAVSLVCVGRGFAQDNATPLSSVVDQMGGHTLRLAFDDEFDTLNLRHGDQGVWSTSFGYNGIDNFTLTPNQERELYVDPQFTGSGNRPLLLQPFAVHDGILTISADRVPAAMKKWVWGYRYYSGLLTTRRSFSQQYGYFEIRAQLPAQSGAWPAFWLLRPDGTWPPEIDAFEYLGRDPSVFWAGFHSTAPGSASTPINQRTPIPGPLEQFHTYGVLWDREHVVWYLDRVEVRRIATPADMHTPLYVLVNLAIGGGGWAGAPNLFTHFPIRMSVDYVRVYALEGG
jgi:beta-glucanase (GH16 family)